MGRTDAFKAAARSAHPTAGFSCRVDVHQDFYRSAYGVRAELPADDPERVEISRIRTFTASTSRVALDDGVLLPEGMDASMFDSRPVVLWAHDDYDLGIGRVLGRRRAADYEGWEMDVEFAPREVNEFADDVLRFIDWAGFGACSIRFNVVELDREPEPAELIKYGLPRYGWIARKWQLLELSICNVQADPGALMKGVAAGAFSARTADALSRRWAGVREDPPAAGEAAPAAEEPAAPAPDKAAPLTAEGCQQIVDAAVSKLGEVLAAGIAACSDAILALSEKMDSMMSSGDEEPMDDAPGPEVEEEPVAQGSASAPHDDEVAMGYFAELLGVLEEKVNA